MGPQGPMGDQGPPGMDAVTMNLHPCKECGAFTLKEGEEAHRAWHERLLNLLDLIAERID